MTDKINDKITLFEKIHEYKFFLLLFCFIFSFDCYLGFVYYDSILSMDIGTYFQKNNFKLFLLFVIVYAFLIVTVIPIIHFLLYKGLFILQSKFRNKKKSNENEKEYIDIFKLHESALRQESEFKLNRVKEWYKNKANVNMIVNYSIFSVLIVICNFLLGKIKNINTITYVLYTELRNNGWSFANAIIVICALCFMCMSLFVIIFGYSNFWDNTIAYPLGEEKRTENKEN